MSNYNKITALYSRLSVGDEDRDGGESNSIQNQKIFLENYAKGQHLTNIRHYIDDDESGRFFDRSAYSRMMDDVENGKIGVCIMKDLTRWGRDYLQVGNAMEIFRRNNVRFIAVNNGIDSEKPDTLEFAPGQQGFLDNRRGSRRGCPFDFPSVYRWEEPQPNRRISDTGANPNPHFLYERPRTGNL